MSRVGNNPILIPDGVNVQINPGEVVVSGKLGTMNQSYDCVVVEQKDNQIVVSRNKNNNDCLLYTSPSPRDQSGSRMPSSA